MEGESIVLVDKLDYIEVPTSLAQIKSFANRAVESCVALHPGAGGRVGILVHGFVDRSVDGSLVFFERAHCPIDVFVLKRPGSSENCAKGVKGVVIQGDGAGAVTGDQVPDGLRLAEVGMESLKVGNLGWA